MKVISIGLMLGSFMLRFCGSSDAPPAAAAPPGVVAVAPAQPSVVPGEPARPVVQGALRAPRHGGTNIAAGAYQVELVTKHDGTVVAYVAGADGSAPGAGATVQVKLKGTDGAEHPVALAWNAGSARFEGRFAGFSLASGPAEVVLVANGQAAQGTGVLTVAANGDTVIIGPDGVHVNDRDGDRVQVQGGRLVATERSGNQVVMGAGGGVVTSASGERVIMGPGGIQVRQANGQTVDIGAGGVIAHDGRVQVGPHGVTVQGGSGTVDVSGSVGTDDDSNE